MKTKAQEAMLEALHEFHVAKSDFLDGRRKIEESGGQYHWEYTLTHERKRLEEAETKFLESMDGYVDERIEKREDYLRSIRARD